MFECLPLPKLSPQSVKMHIPLSEYCIYNDIPTDKAHYPSAVILLGEEALSWQRMSSDSDSDGEYQTDRDYEDPFGFGGYKSNNSVSDSDEDFMCSLTKKKGKSNLSIVVTPSSRTGGAKRGRGLKKEAKELQAELPPPLESINPSFSRSNPFPPPLLPTKEDRVDKNNVLMDIPAVPALVKVLPDFKLSEDSALNYYTCRSETEDGYVTNKYSSDVTHIQPPPALIMPAKVKPEKSTSIHSRNAKLPEPPPLLRNSYSLDSPTSISLSDNHPHIVLPSDISLPSHLLKQPTDSVDWTGSLSLSTSHHSSLDHPSPPSPSSLTASPKRLGRPPKSRPTGSQQPGKKSATLRPGSTTAHFKPSKSTKGHTSSYSVKGMKMTRYEFQPTHSPDGGDVQMQPFTTTQHIHDPTPHTQPAIMSPVASNIVSPVQIIQRASGNPQQVQSYQAIQPGSVLLMQGTRPYGVDYSPQQQISPSYITQDGQTYQIVQTQSQHYTSPDHTDNSQKVSVIMQPGVSSSGGFIRSTGVGGIQYITQLDGPPPPPGKSNKKGNSGTTGTLKETFEQARRKEQAKLLELKTNSKTVKSKSHVSPSKAQNLTISDVPQETGPPSSQSSTGAGMSESLMSEQLKIYFKREVARKIKPSSSPVSDSSSQSRVGVDKLKQKSQSRKQRSSPSTSSETVSVVMEKPQKPPRFVISPNVFLSSVTPVYSPTSMSGMESGSVVSGMESGSVVSSGHPTSMSGMESGNVVSSGQLSASKNKSRKDVKRKHSSPDLSNLFQPDNLNLRSTFKDPQSFMDVDTDLSNSLSQVTNKPISFDCRPTRNPNCFSPQTDDMDNGKRATADEFGASPNGSLSPASYNSNNCNSNDMTTSPTTSSLNSSTDEGNKEGGSEGNKRGENQSTSDKQDITRKSKLGKRQTQTSKQGETSEEVVPPSTSPAPKRKRGRPPGKSNKVKKAELVRSQVNVECRNTNPPTSSKECVVPELQEQCAGSSASSKTPEGGTCSGVATNSTPEGPKRAGLGKRSAHFREQADLEFQVQSSVLEQDEPLNLEGQEEEENTNRITVKTPQNPKRGRPKKNSIDSLAKGPVADSIAVAGIIPVVDIAISIGSNSNTNSTISLCNSPQISPAKKKRGRPRKVLNSTSTEPITSSPMPVSSTLNTISNLSLSDSPQTPPVKRKRGRPRKVLNSTSTGSVSSSSMPVPDTSIPVSDTSIPVPGTSIPVPDTSIPVPGTPILVVSTSNTTSSPSLSDVLDSTSTVSPSASIKFDSNNSILESRVNQQTKAKSRPRKGKKKSFECEKCRTVYTTKLGLKYHTDSVHPPDILVR